MCSRAEWERVVRKVEEAVDEGFVRAHVLDVAARIEALFDEIIDGACVPEDAEWVRDRRRSRPTWVV